MSYDYKETWQRNIDKIEFYEGHMRITCADGKILTGKSGSASLGTNADGEDVDGVIFDTDEGIGYVLIEDDIREIEFLDE